MDKDIPHWRQTSSTASSHTGFSRARKLELEVSAVRHALYSLRSEYLELALQASLLSSERDTALRNLKRTEDYLASVQPGFIARRSRPDRVAPEPVVTAAADVAAPALISAAGRKPRWRKVVDVVKQHTLLSSQLENDLSVLRQELTSLSDDYGRLERYVDALEYERDVARENLEQTSHCCISAPQPDQAAADAAPSVAAESGSEQQMAEAAPASGLDDREGIADVAAERHRVLAYSLSEADHSRSEIDNLNERILSAERELADSRDANREMMSRLANLDTEFDRTRRGDAEQIAVLEERIGRLEPALERARGDLQSLEASLAEANSSHADVRQQNEVLSTHLAERDAQLAQLREQHERQRQRVDELEQELGAAANERTALQEQSRTLTATLEAEKTRTAERDDKVVELQRQHEQLRDQINILQISLADTERGQLAASQENHALAQELAQRNTEFGALINADRVRAEDLEQQIAGLQSALALARSDCERLESSLQAQTAGQAEVQRLHRQLEHAVGEGRSKLAERDLQLVESQAQQTQLQVEVEALTRQLDEARKQETVAADEQQALSARLEAALEEYRNTHSKDREEIAGLSTRLVGLEPKLAAATQQVETLEASLSEAAYHLEVANKRVSTLEQRLKERESAAKLPQQAVVSQPAPPRRHSGWARAAVGLVLLLSIMVSVVALRDLYQSYRGAESSGSSGQLAGSQEKTKARPAEKQIALLEKRAGSGSAEKKHSSGRPAAPQVTKPAVQTKPQRATASPAPAAPSRQVTVPSQLRQQDSVVARLSAAKGGGPHVQAYLMQPDDSASDAGRPCVKDGKPCTPHSRKSTRPAIIELPSGVKYSVIKNGTGRSPEPGDTVVINYHGVLPDGTTLDSSREKNGAEAFRLSEAIPGLQDVLQYMEEGAKWEVYVPGNLGFRKPGPYGAQEVVFVIELMAVSGADGGEVEIGRHKGEDFFDATAPQTPEADVVTRSNEPDTGRSERVAASYNTRAGMRAFFAENAQKDGVVSLPSGLQYKVLKSGNGSGRKPTASDRVSVRYRGILPDGREFDSSEAKGGELTLTLKDAIPGWRQALLQMEEGATWQLYLPPALAASGKAVRKRSVSGLQPVIYDIELVAIQ